MNCADSTKSMQSIAFIGSVGIPNQYGGFESFLENVCPVMSNSGAKVIVTCDAGRYKNREPMFKGVKRVFVPINANGSTSPLHDLLAFFMVFWRVDSICVLGVSAGPFFFIMRLFASLFGKSLLINVDGVEWRREKFSKFTKFVLRAFDASAQLAAHKIIIDSPALFDFIFSKCKKKAQYIPYSGDHVIRKTQGKSCEPGHCLTICRIEPENNIEMLIQGVLASNVLKYTIIGNWENSEFGSALRKKYQNFEKLALLDPVYDAQIIAEHRETCAIYLHGHSVGGTNPSLVEMLFYDCEILCYDCVFNKITANGSAGFFASVAELTSQISAILEGKKYRKTADLSIYTNARIAEQYLAVAHVPKEVVIKLGWKESALVFAASVACVLCALFIERRIGIGWNFHPDATTYMTVSKLRLAEYMAAGTLKSFINGGHYVLSALLGQNINFSTAVNIIVFALTNLFLLRSHKKACVNKKGFVWLFLLFILMFNPYRVHLATTVLKDTLIIFFLVGIVCSKWAQLPFIGLLLIWRAAGVFYLTLRVPKKLFPLVVLLGAIGAAYYWDNIKELLVKQSNVNMQFRKFDLVPSFANLGALGIALRALMWPLFAISGAFFIFSPTIPFLPIFLGAIFALWYNYAVYKSFSLKLAVFLPMAFIAAITPGFTTYYRYVFPLLVALPLYLNTKKSAALF